MLCIGVNFRHMLNKEFLSNFKTTLENGDCFKHHVICLNTQLYSCNYHVSAHAGSLIHHIIIVVHICLSLDCLYEFCLLLC